MSVYFFVVPLTVAISLVYAATRHESWRRILPHAARLCTVILTIMVVATALLLLIHSRVG